MFDPRFDSHIRTSLLVLTLVAGFTVSMLIPSPYVETARRNSQPSAASQTKATFGEVESIGTEVNFRSLAYVRSIG